MLELKLLILIMTANGAPIIARKLFADRYDCPLDAGWILPDGHPLLGASKTVRGLIAALVATVLTGLLLGIPLQASLIIGFLAMAGDLLSSFVKRRLGKPPGSRFIGLDQIPESLLPLLALKSMFDLSLAAIAAIVTAFVISELLLSRFLYKLHIRKHPY